MLPSSGSNTPLSMSDINRAFNSRGNNLNAYRGSLFYRPNNSRGFFPAGVIRFSDFYDTSGNSPVVPQSYTLPPGSFTRTLPMFNIVTFTVRGGDGGQAGQSGNSGSGGPGGAGGDSYINGNAGRYITGSGGSAGQPSLGFGGTGGTTTLTWNVDTDWNLSIHYNENISIVVGNRGGGGSGGITYENRPYWSYEQRCNWRSCWYEWVLRDNVGFWPLPGGAAGPNTGYVTVEIS